MMFPSLMEKEAVRFSGLAKTFGSPGAVGRTVISVRVLILKEWFNILGNRHCHFIVES